MTTAYDIARNLWAAWWPFIALGAVVVGLPWLIVKALGLVDHTFDDLGSPDAWGIDDLIDGDTWAARQGLVQTDAEADAEWCAILAAVGLTPADVRARYEATPIHDRLAAERLRAELDDDVAVERWMRHG